MNGWVKTLISCNYLSDPRVSLLCFQVVRFRDISRTLLWNFATWRPFMLCMFHFNRCVMHSQRNRINSFGQDWRKRFLHLLQNNWNTWRVERFCVFIVQIFLTVSASPVYKILREWIWCLYNNAIDRLCVATNQSKIGQRERTLHLDTSQLVLNQVPIVC